MARNMIDTSGLFNIDILVSDRLPYRIPARNEGDEDLIVHLVQMPDGRVIVSKELLEKIKEKIERSNQ